MIPDKKRTPEEISALRVGLGIPDPTPEPVTHRLLPTMAQPPIHIPVPLDIPHAAYDSKTSLPEAPVLDPAHPDHPLPDGVADPILHLDVVPVPDPPKNKPMHSLRKHERPLAPAPAVTHKTQLPSQRHDLRDIAEIRKRETLAKLQQQEMDPAAHLRRQIASPFLYGPGYLFVIAAAAVAYLRVHHITPLALIGVTIAIMIFIAIRKPRSRHHAALLFILIFLTLVFGGLHYAPLFDHGP